MTIFSPPFISGNLDDPGTALTLFNALKRSSERLHIRANMITSLDGASDVDGKSGPLGTPADKMVFDTARAETQAILVGASTAIIESYDRPKIDERLRHLRPNTHPSQPTLIVVCRTWSPQLDIWLQGLASDDGAADVIVLTPDSPDHAHYDNYSSWLRVHQCTGEDPLDELHTLCAQHSITTLLCEGGPRVLGELISRRMVDDMMLTLSPLIVGSHQHPIVTTAHDGVHGFSCVHAFSAPDGGLYTLWSARTN